MQTLMRILVIVVVASSALLVAMTIFRFDLKAVGQFLLAPSAWTPHGFRQLREMNRWRQAARALAMAERRYGDPKAAALQQKILALLAQWETSGQRPSDLDGLSNDLLDIALTHIPKDR